jgi:hypothetical protein
MLTSTHVESLDDVSLDQRCYFYVAMAMTVLLDVSLNSFQSMLRQSYGLECLPKQANKSNNIARVGTKSIRVFL